MFSGGIERDQWHEMGQSNPVGINRSLSSQNLRIDVMLNNIIELYSGFFIIFFSFLYCENYTNTQLTDFCIL